jgi:hypothetical protein
MPVGLGNPISVRSGVDAELAENAIVEGLMLQIIACLCCLALSLRAYTSMRHWKTQRLDTEQQRVDGGLLDRMTQRLDLHQKTQRIDPKIEHEFRKVFMFTSNEGKEALINRNKCSRGEAMRLAIDEWQRENR